MSKPKKEEIKEQKIVGEPKPLTNKKKVRKRVKKKELMGVEDYFNYVDMLEAKIEHIEDTMIDIRTVILKLTAQSNNIVIFLKELEKDLFPPEMNEQIEREFNHPFSDVNKVSDDMTATKIERFMMIKEMCEKNEEILKELLKDKTNSKTFTFNEIGEA